MFTTFPWLYVRLFDCFKQLPVHFTLILSVFLIQFIHGVRLLSDLLGRLIVSSDNPLEFHNKT